MHRHLDATSTPPWNLQDQPGICTSAGFDGVWSGGCAQMRLGVSQRLFSAVTRFRVCELVLFSRAPRMAIRCFPPTLDIYIYI